MNRLLTIRATRWLIILALVLGSSFARADVSIELGVFYDNLAPYGAWVDHPRYQTVWIPNNMPAGWRPYTRGHWVMTDPHGWTWQSDFDWGWAPFHYGRWAFDNRYGWFWVPGQVWGPGWVAWRSGGDYIGWAALPPEAGWDDDYGIQYINHDEFYGVAATSWIFVRERYFVTPQIYRYAFVPSRNTRILRVTNNITRFRVEDHRIVNHCIPVRRIEEVTRQPVRVMHINEYDDHHRWRESRHDADRINIYRPRINRVEASAPLRQNQQQRSSSSQRLIIKERHDDIYRLGEQPANKYPQQRNEPRRLGEQPINKYPQQPRSEQRREESHEERREIHRLDDSTRRITAPPPQIVPRHEERHEQREIQGTRTSPGLGAPAPHHEQQQERKLEKQQKKAARKAEKKHQKDERKIERKEQQENKKSFGRDDDRR